MKVKDLIEKLKELDPNREIVFYGSEKGDPYKVKEEDISIEEDVDYLDDEEIKYIFYVG